MIIYLVIHKDHYTDDQYFLFRNDNKAYLKAREIVERYDYEMTNEERGMCQNTVTVNTEIVFCHKLGVENDYVEIQMLETLD